MAPGPDTFAACSSLTVDDDRPPVAAELAEQLANLDDAGWVVTGRLDVKR